MPGTSGLLSPFSDLNSFYFSETDEPEDFIIKFNEDINKIIKTKGVEYIDINCNTKEDYFTIVNALTDFNDTVKVSGLSNKNYTIKVEEKKGKKERAGNFEVGKDV